MDDKLLLMIEEYADGELNREDESFLFEQLAVNAEARTYFRNINLVKNELESAAEEFPSHLEKIIITRMQSPADRISFSRLKLAAAVVSAVLILLSIITFRLLNEVSGYRQEISQVITQLKEQNKTIETLYNCFPPAVIHPVYSNEIIIKPKI